MPDNQVILFRKSQKVFDLRVWPKRRLGKLEANVLDDGVAQVQWLTEPLNSFGRFETCSAVHLKAASGTAQRRKI